MNFWRKYAWVAFISARSNLAYFDEVSSRFVFLAIMLYIFLRLWKVAYSETNSTHLAGMTLSQMLWYLSIAEAITMSAPRLTLEVDEDVRTGALAVQMVRPMFYPLYRLSVAMGERLVRFLSILIAGAVIATVLVGPIAFDPIGLALFTLSLPLAFLLEHLGSLLIGLGAFWLEDTSGLNLIYARMKMILGGMLFPLDLFPSALQPLLRALPFSAMVYGPAKLFVQPSLTGLSDLLLKQGAAVAGFGLAICIVYGLALKRVYSNGG